MSPQHSNTRSLLRHLFGLLCFPVIGLLVAMAWLWITAGLMGIGRTGFGNAAAIIVMPVWAIGIGLLVWLPWWLFHSKKWGVMNPARALISGAVIGFIVSLLLTGPAGFTTHGGAALMAYAILLISIVGAWAHNWLMNR